MGVVLQHTRGVANKVVVCDFDGTNAVAIIVVAVQDGGVVATDMVATLRGVPRAFRRRARAHALG